MWGGGREKREPGGEGNVFTKKLSNSYSLIKN